MNTTGTTKDVTTTRELIANLLAAGAAQDAGIIITDRAQGKRHHVERIAHSRGKYGAGAGLYIDTDTGELYATTSRATTAQLPY